MTTEKGDIDVSRISKNKIPFEQFCLELHARGMMSADIARTLERSPAQVSATLKRRGLEPNPHPKLNLSVDDYLAQRSKKQKTAQC
jgi:hypothetical protein